jgi:hypothetical protein
MVFGLAAFAGNSARVSASSHREAPLISQDPTADGTDVYAFRSPDNPSTVTLIANWIPLEQPAGGPNFYKFGDDVLYTINVDNVGDGRAHVLYLFRFHSQTVNPNTFLYNTGPITSLDDPDYNLRQFYDVVRVERRYSGEGAARKGADDASDNVLDYDEARARGVVIASNVPVPPVNIGPRSTPNYEALAAAAIKPLNGGGQVFAGQRDDPFFVDLGSIFDLGGLRPLNEFHVLPLPAAPGVDGVAGYNVNTIALQVPISSLGASNDVIGVWATAYRSKVRVIQDGGYHQTGPWVQVSRLGMPLTNEAIIPVGRKDYWNSAPPSEDSDFDTYLLNPELAGLENVLYPVLQDTETANRQDLLAVFHTGVPGLNTLPQTTHADELRLNMSIPVSGSPSRLGVLDGDLQGFPNGRRLGDDIVDIELRAVACAYGAVDELVYGLTNNCNPATYRGTANYLVADGLDANDKAFTAAFPYMATPFQGYEAQPPTAPEAAAQIGLGVAGVLAAGALVTVYRRRRFAE